MRSGLKALSLLSMAAVLFTLLSCGNFVMNTVADGLSAPGGTTFTGENDPELVGDALPFALKMYDSILEQVPDHSGMLLAAGSAYIMYANAFLQTPAMMLPSSEYEKKELQNARAKNLYDRGRNLVFRGLERRHPGFTNAFYTLNTNTFLKGMNKDDVPYLYWAAAGWFASFSLNGLDVGMSRGTSLSAMMMKKAWELNPSHSDGSISDFFISYYGSMPLGMGGDDAKAKEFYEKTLQITGGKNPSPYISYATSISVKNQNKKEFTELMNKALEIDVNQNISNRLASIIAQRKAKWYLDHIDDFFVGE